jgi:hypothetical protein
MFAGSLLSGVALDVFTEMRNGVPIHNWTAFWLTCGTGAFAILLLVAVFFRSDAKIRSKA